MIQSKLPYLYHGSPTVKMLALSALLLFLHYPICKDDYRTLHNFCKQYFSRILRIDHVHEGRGPHDELLSLCLEVEATLVLCNVADSFAKLYSQNFLSPHFASDLQKCLATNIYIYIYYTYYTV